MIAAYASGSDSVLQFFTVFLVFVLVLGITLLTTKWIAGYQKNQMKGKNMEVIESNRVGQNKFVQIVRIGDKYMAIGLGKDEITMLTELDLNQIVLPENGKTETVDFKEMLEKTKNLMKKK